MKIRFIIFSVWMLLNINNAKSQTSLCISKVNVTLQQINGVPYQGINVILKDKTNSATFQKITDKAGNVQFEIPCNKNYLLTAANYAIEKEFTSMEEGGILTYRFNYEPEMKKNYQLSAYSPEELNEINLMRHSLPDSVDAASKSISGLIDEDYFSDVSVSVVDLNNKPLNGEVLTFKSKKNKKIITAITDHNGVARFNLLKGDRYYLNFRFDKDFDSIDFGLQRGKTEKQLIYTYLGSAEVERRQLKEAQRLAVLAERKKKLDEEFKSKCKTLGITEDEGLKMELDKCINDLFEFRDTIVTSVLNRNIWKNKLIVCDLTGSMTPYSAQLLLWYQLNQKNEKNLQFVFFNDGDSLPDLKKRIGSTGGVYYSASMSSDSLRKFMLRVTRAGNGGDVPENNMEALIKGTKQSKPFTELVMVVDNTSPVKDMELLKDFHIPVHIILCGATAESINPDYLMIAWKTKGTLHTIEQDITKIANMMEGEEIIINGFTYRINGGKFILKEIL